MSTKNLARTVIEGGRSHYNRWERRNSNARVRASERDVSQRLLTAHELDDALYPPRRPVYRGFSDKLAPAERWLGSQVGRPWSKVRSELFARFDTRTTAGRHILFDHLLRDVSDGHPSSSVRADFSVDRHGILRRLERRRPRWRPWARLPEARSVLEAWLAGRRVGARGERHYWFVVTDSGAFRQHHELSDAETARWRSLPEWFQNDFCVSTTPESPESG